jgi:flagellar FliJ protein
MFPRNRRQAEMDRKANRLRHVVALAERDEQNECLEMKKVQQALDQAVDRLNELETYRRKYRSGPTLKSSVGAIRWQDYQRFLARLNQAVESQNQFVTTHVRTLEVHRRRWQEKHQRVGLLEKIVQRYIQAEAQRDQRSMQKALDELQPAAKSFD